MFCILWLWLPDCGWWCCWSVLWLFAGCSGDVRLLFALPAGTVRLSCSGAAANESLPLVGCRGRNRRENGHSHHPKGRISCSSWSVRGSSRKDTP